MTDAAVPDLVPARILNEHVYCPRLAWLEWSEREFRHNADTAEGDYVHRRVDAERGRPASSTEIDPDADELPPTTSVSLDAPIAGISAKLDMLRLADGRAIPVEYKRGRPRDGDDVVWAPERIQLAAYAMVLREHGYRVEHGEVWFAETRTRHIVELTEADERAVAVAVAEARSNALRDEAPRPLVDSPKCPRCSLVGLCLPDEVNYLAGQGRVTRRLIAPDPVATPLYATTPGARITKRGGRVVLKEQGVEISSRRLLDVAHIAVFGNVDIGSALLRECFEHGIPVLWLTTSGWFSGAAFSPAENAVALRMRQHRAAALGRPDIAAAMIAGKIRNQRTLLRRHGGAVVAPALDQLADLARQAAHVRSLESLLGLEGTAARIYFSRFGSVLHGDAAGFDFESRNRRPARDPVNAVLSFVYALLLRDVVIALHAAGLDPYVGLLHRPRFGRPSLALDLMEELRPLVGDSTVMLAINNGELRPSDVVRRAGAVALTAPGRRRVIEAYERRMRTHITHPLFGYRAGYRRVIEIQARLLASVLAGDIDAYRPLTTR